MRVPLTAAGIGDGGLLRLVLVRRRLLELRVRLQANRERSLLASEGQMASAESRG